MDPRRRFLAALGLFGLWVLALGAMVLVSSTRPRDATVPSDSRPAAAVR